jgi:arylsulfatase A-like enzyme
MSVDDLVGRVIGTLGSLRERRRTIAFFLSDNGFLWGEHGLRRKGQPYTASIKIPLLMAWPGHVAPGSRDSRYATTVDIAPTILAAAGITPAEPMDGRSLLSGSTRGHLFTEYYRTEFQRWTPGWASIRTPRFQYVEYYDDARSDVVFREYYRLDRDPWQLTNVLRDGNPANNPRTGPLHRLLAHYRACSASSCP